MYAFITISLILIILIIGLLIWILIPKFLEAPNYIVKKSEAKIELRQYDNFLMTKVIINGDQNEALRNGFRPLVRFIGAKERSTEKISMTVPVMQEKTSSKKKWLVAFSMPSKYTLDNLPRPTSKTLKQEEVPIKLMAAIRFNGRATEDILLFKEIELKDWIHRNKLKVIGLAHYYFYNDPITPGFFRRNEVLFEVTQNGSSTR
jgi:hypothetical protein